MAYTEKQAREFIDKMAPMIVAEGTKRGYKIFSTAIAQAIIEGAAGTSLLASKYHNHFGMKCGPAWFGNSVNLQTKEEYQKGVLSSISSNFRVYEDDREGVKGYYNFINTKRYMNLKQAVTYQQYAEMIKADGYATSSTYVDTLCKTVEKYGLMKYDAIKASAPLKKDILIAQASIGESGIRGQIAGNQTGRELNIRKYYKHKQGWRLFRYPDAVVQNKIAFAALNGVNNDRIGYDQLPSNRNSLFTAAQKYGYDPGAVKVDVETDCSAFVRCCIAYAGHVLPDFSTYSEPDILKKFGFVEMNFDQDTGNGLLIGDILVTKGKGHTCMVVQA